jgi:hypothetical protein
MRKMITSPTDELIIRKYIAIQDDFVLKKSSLFVVKNSNLGQVGSVTHLRCFGVKCFILT